MGVLDELSSATGDKGSNKELIKQCLVNPAFLHTIAEGLRTGSQNVKVDCAEILITVCKTRPELLANFVTDFLDASRAKVKKIAKLGFSGLFYVTRANPNEVYAEREYLLHMAQEGGSLRLPAVEVIAALCGNNPNYRGKLLGNLMRIFNTVTDKDLPQWVKAVAPAVEGSADAFKRLERTLAGRLDTLPEQVQKRLDKLIVKLERSTVKRKKK